jgi:hypothetical protein
LPILVGKMETRMQCNRTLLKCSKILMNARMAFYKIALLLSCTPMISANRLFTRILNSYQKLLMEMRAHADM